MQFLGIVFLLLDIVTAVHAVRTGRTRPWVMVILFVPLVGALVYLIAIMIPELMASRRSPLPDTEPEDIASLEAKLSRTPSSLNRENIVRAYIRKGRYAQAIDTARGGLRGKRVEAHLRMLLVEAHLEQGEPDEARSVLTELEARSPNLDPQRRLLLLGRVACAEGSLETAATHFEEAARVGRGEEAHYRLAQTLDRLGRTEEAQKIFTKILQRAESADPAYTTAQAQWIRSARRASRG